jgi:mRNA interferase YafQ
MSKKSELPLKIKEIDYGKRFAKSMELAKRRKKDLAKIFTIIEMLRRNESIPARHRNHKLTGNYEGYWELHIEPDWLLIYKMTKDKLILADTGTHADLFE